MLERESIHKEIDLVQDIIKRMTQNSFQVKAWLVGILSVLIAVQRDEILLSASGKNMSLWSIALLYLPIVSFWYLDAHFLSIERRYRELYKWIVKNRPYTNLYLYDLNTFDRTVDERTENLEKKKNTLGVVWRSHTLLLFYVIPLVFVTALLLRNLLR